MLVTDEIGNLYYSNNVNYNDLNAKRWVIFNGEIEASKIPPHWHAWLHKSIDIPPLNYSNINIHGKKIMKKMLTGTDKTLIIQILILYQKTINLMHTSDYETWNPLIFFFSLFFLFNHYLLT